MWRSAVVIAWVYLPRADGGGGRGRSCWERSGREFRRAGLVRLAFAAPAGSGGGLLRFLELGRVRAALSEWVQRAIFRLVRGFRRERCRRFPCRSESWILRRWIPRHWSEVCRAAPGRRLGERGLPVDRSGVRRRGVHRRISGARHGLCRW